MKKIFICLLVILSTAALGQQLDPKIIIDLGKQAITQAIDNRASNQASKDWQNSIDQLIEKTDQEKNKDLGPVTLTAGTTFAVELDQNNTTIESAALTAKVKAALARSLHLKPAANFGDRNQVQVVNGQDRSNEEIRNPIGKHEMTRAAIDVHIVASEYQQLSQTGIDAQLLDDCFLRAIGFSVNYDQFRELRLIEVVVDFRDAASNESLGIVDVIGCDTAGYRLQVDSRARTAELAYRRDSSSNLPIALDNALAQVKPMIDRANRPKRS